LWKKKSSESRKNDSCQEVDKKVSHLAWKIKGRASVCGTRKLRGFSIFSVREKKYR
jgi:hypothetical protein